MRANFGTTTTVTGADLRFVGPPSVFREHVTVVDYDRAGNVRARTSDPAAVNRLVGLNADTLKERDASAETGASYYDFQLHHKIAPANYVVGRTGSRTLEIDFPTPSPRCPGSNYKLIVDWSWRRNRVTHSRVSGSWTREPKSPCAPGPMKADNHYGFKGTSKHPGFVSYGGYVAFYAPAEDLKTHKLVQFPTDTEPDQNYAAFDLGLRADGTARYGGSYGDASKPQMDLGAF